MYVSITAVFLILLQGDLILSQEKGKPFLLFEYETNIDTAVEGNCLSRPKLLKTVFAVEKQFSWFDAMANCKMNGMALAEFGSVEEQILVSQRVKQIFPSGKNFSWYEKTWMGAAAITNSEYPKEVEVPIPQWYWFNTGDKIPQDYKGWNPEHELSEYHTYWHAYRGCALLYLSGEIRATACHPVYPSLCEVVKSLA